MIKWCVICGQIVDVIGECICKNCKIIKEEKDEVKKVFEKVLDELSDTMMERYGDIEDTKQGFEEIINCLEIDPIRLLSEMKEYVKNKLTIIN